MSQPVIRLFGLPRCGTNVWQRTMQGNFKCRVVQGDNRKHVWKHGCYCRCDNKPLLVTVRHPLSYLWGTYKVLGKCRLRGMFRGCETFKDFLMDLQLPSRENPFLHRWSFAYGYWLWRSRCSSVPIALRRWEDLLESPEAECRNAAVVLGLEADGDFSVVEKQVGPHQTRPGGYELIRRQELEEREYLEHYDDEALEFVEDRLDPAVVQEYGYSLP